VGYLSDRIGVMFRGRIVELADAEEILRNPVHPYTQALFTSVPGLTGEGIARRVIHVRDEEAAMKAGLPRQRQPAAPHGTMAVHGIAPRTIFGCRFADRCSQGEPACLENEPDLVDIGGGHLVACIVAKKPARQSSA
jgi:ABC-type dipeptide/oligopeptide/nickel transport system ATPase component